VARDPVVEGVAVEDADADAGLAGGGLEDLRVELRLGEDGPDAGRAEPGDELGDLARARLAAGAAQDEADLLEPVAASHVGVGVVVGNELALRRWDRADLLADGAVELAQLGEVALGVGSVAGRAGRVDGRQGVAELLDVELGEAGI